ncbi:MULTISPECIES: TSUP family transporter [unclassified Novosphingobium]|uniref:TSUP family transporter n=1 Tax=unclassified Novosphingobium TaxID=2644732 RepID=UPI001494B637|nr:MULTISPECIES: TSUP family transporter [unclassified Novosphingobium]MBB3356979.1 hypothetical protein [Novosphingobium sp. BK256]MBB3373380.1 hypothetical protein [Novosphingobium sp. BK280]MBB3377749.1 hypothetical protein [Novosphingobium sp. BK258]MBB3418840.1 hypothetical protein [Novosphingobium sp. BK267]MBB3450325.1 hypothetical protein [Novosphingobium sp. BK352]
MTDHLLSVTFVASAFFAAGFIQGTLGFGFQAMASGLLILLPGLEIPTNLIMPAIIANAWQVTAAPSFPMLLRRFGALSAGVLAGSAAVRLMGIHTNGFWPAAFGLKMLATSATALLFGERKVPPRWERWLSPFVGLGSGLVGGVTGIAFPALLYLIMLKLERDERVAALGCFFIALLPALLVFPTSSTSDHQISLNSIWQIAPAALGYVFGRFAYREIDGPMLGRWYKLGLLFLGANLTSI